MDVSAPTKIVSLFSGFAGLDLSVRLIFPESRVQLFVEREVAAVEVLARRMAEGSLDDAPVWSDVRTVDGNLLRGHADMVVGGFPCQDLSNAGRRAGISGERSGLWFEFARILREVRPSHVFMENVGAITIRGIDAVLGSLADIGFDAEWMCLSAKDVGASHLRKRWFCLAYARSGNLNGRSPEFRVGRHTSEWCQTGDLAGDGGELLGPDEEYAFTWIDGIGGPDDIERHLDDAGINGRRSCEQGRGSSGGIAAGWSSGAGCEFVGDPEHSGTRDGEEGRGRQQALRWTAEGFGPFAPGDRDAGLEAGRDGDSRPAHMRQLRPEVDAQHDGAVPILRKSHAGNRDIFAPGPSDPRWRDILRDAPWLAPAISEEEAESIVRRMVAGPANGLVFADRIDRLRGLGNLVVAQQGACALALLWQRVHGKFPWEA